MNDAVFHETVETAQRGYRGTVPGCIWKFGFARPILKKRGGGSKKRPMTHMTSWMCERHVSTNCGMVAPVSGGKRDEGESNLDKIESKVDTDHEGSIFRGRIPGLGKGVMA